MAGTKAGGKAAASTNKSKYGADFYRYIGARGGANGHTGGFYANRELARAAGAKGGSISRRGKAKPKAEFMEEPTARVPSSSVVAMTKYEYIWKRLCKRVDNYMEYRVWTACTHHKGWVDSGLWQVCRRCGAKR